ncbi:anhydro-N-acetylmuramic acid kinase [Aestuariibacter sp. A3R04]|uniref:anhydro-N-acetylmuramic acid kinase n=1 Tax=Aestuariibacter sp. A3R04 TaxID=2841571 RepID=UPI001C0A3D7C|nr:anhydro-N-acetylmuramic acid kinase [Aestuariibacter sp. A3R04]MBU3020547.1 anhydro-N-acetylmuramic acid kinase [Aestuariibacter sp. A3R04]
MKSYIQKLYHSSEKQSRRIIGLMSGTSLDGLDIALCHISGHGLKTSVELEKFVTVPYETPFRHAVQRIFAKRDVDLQEVTLLNGWIAEQHAEMINKTLKTWQVSACDIDCIASHGQTVFHCPKEQHGLGEYGHGTLQIGDGDRLAVLTGIITLSDFRQKHIAAGGEGAPLAVYGDYLMFSDPIENRLLLNMGGIANFTWLPAGNNASSVFSTDVGPGNTIIDAFVAQHFSHLRYDKDGKLAAAGKVNEDLLHSLLSHEFFSYSMPKTTGPEVFNLDYLKQARITSQTLAISDCDVIATLTAFSARAICNGIVEMAGLADNNVVYASGGGVHNPVLMEMITTLLPNNIRVCNLSEIGISPDAKEAVLFAILANETIAGTPCFEGNRYDIPNTTMGKVSLP